MKLNANTTFPKNNSIASNATVKFSYKTKKILFRSSMHNIMHKSCVTKPDLPTLKLGTVYK